MFPLSANSSCRCLTGLKALHGSPLWSSRILGEGVLGGLRGNALSIRLRSCFLRNSKIIPSGVYYSGRRLHTLGSMSESRVRGDLKLLRLRKCLNSQRYASSRSDVQHGHRESVLKEKEVRTKMKETPTDSQTLLVIQPEYKSGVLEKPYVPAESKLEEAVSLAEAITGWTVHSQRVDTIRRPHNRFLFGKGKTAELRTAVSQLPVTGVFINVPTLTPLQQRSLVELFETDVFDRFSIVLKIFKERAHTREAKVQVELAEIPYLKSRLVEEEGGFDQQRGGTGKTGGGGETSLEVHRRNLQKREKALKEELKHIRAQHRLTSVHRAKHCLPVVAVVGYTNAGKTTLIKALSKDSHMHPEDMLFATLDTTVHAVKLPCGLKVLFVDTIGFVSDLPHELVESFASTLDDVTNADVLVHVYDASHPQSHAQRANVQKVLEQLGLRPGLMENSIEVLNKTDRVNTSDLPVMCPDGVLPISAREEVGLKELLLRVEEEVLRATKQSLYTITIPADGPHLSWLYHEATVHSVGPAADEKDNALTDSNSEQLQVEAIMSESMLRKFLAKFQDSIVTVNPTHRQ